MVSETDTEEDAYRVGWMGDDSCPHSRIAPGSKGTLSMLWAENLKDLSAPSQTS